MLLTKHSLSLLPEKKKKVLTLIVCYAHVFMCIIISDCPFGQLVGLLTSRREDRLFYDHSCPLDDASSCLSNAFIFGSCLRL